MNIIDILFPKACLGCGRLGEYICANCHQNIKVCMQKCPVCRRVSKMGEVHKQCRGIYHPSGIYVCFAYSGVLRKILIALKYRFVTSSAQEIVNLAVNNLEQGGFTKHIGSEVVFIPVPLHKRRQNWRGFNQAEIVGTQIANVFGWNYKSDCLVRYKNNIKQAGLNRIMRMENTKNIFRLQNGDLKGKTVIIFDDVFTTGATLFEAIKVIKIAGASNVWGLAIAG